MNHKIDKRKNRFIASTFLLFLSIKGRINFLQLGRYGKHPESLFRYHFEDEFDFLEFNSVLLRDSCCKIDALAFDPSYINKSGKKTPGVGYFWSGVAAKAKWGLEISGIAALDKENHTAFHLDAIQTIDFQENETLLDFYARKIVERKEKLLPVSNYITADAYFSKKGFTDKLTKESFHLISRLRNDADLMYLYKGKQRGGRGRHKKYDGKIRYKNIDKLKVQMVSDVENEQIFMGMVYSKALKMEINLVAVYTLNSKAKWIHKLYFSTDLKQHWKDILELYKLRFQIEFLYRDAKQNTGLNDCQARSTNKLNFHFNTSLTVINLAKIEHWLSRDKDVRGSFSMADIKTLYSNELLLNLFLVEFGINPNLHKNKQRINKLRLFGTIAA